MSWHLAAYTGVFAAPTVSTSIPALNDQVLVIRNGDFFLTRKYDLIFAACMGPTIDSARLESPSLRLPTFPQIVPLNIGVVPIAEPRIDDYSRQPFKLAVNEQLTITTIDPAAAPDQITGIVGLRESFHPLPHGNIYKMRGTSAVTAVANVWSTIEPVTYTNDLPDGMYALVGMTYIAALAQAARCIFTSPGNQILRPGCIGNVLVGGQPFEGFMDGRYGEWGRFDSDNIPNIEVLQDGATAVHEVELFFIQVA